MITPSEIIKKAEKKYPKFLTSLIINESFFPVILPGGKISHDYLNFRQSIIQLIEQSKEKLGYGYTVALKSTKKRTFGEQLIPDQIFIETELDYLKLINKEREVRYFKQDIQLILTELPELKDWVVAHPLEVVKYANKWMDLIKVCHYFIEHPQPNLYVRELPIKVHTKFIENHQAILASLLEFLLPSDLINDVNDSERKFEKRFSLKYDEPLLRVRILDEKIKLKYQILFTDFSIPISQFQELNWGNHRWLITENKMSFLTLPTLENTIALWGSGYKVQILKSVEWLSEAEIFYWGDLDVDGFKILAQLRGYFPRVKSLMMDKKTLTTFASYIGTDTSGSKAF
jgi:hypothetical protein